MKKLEQWLRETYDVSLRAAASLLAVGIAILVAAYIGLSALDIHSLKELSTDTLDFAERYIDNYAKENASRRAEVLVNLSDKAWGFSESLQVETLPTAEQLRSYLTNQKLDGILILDGAGQVISSEDLDGLTAEDWQELLAEQSVLDVAENTRKTYLISLRRGDAVYDLAAIHRSDAAGAVLVYKQRDKDEEERRLQNMNEMFSGYSFQKDGCIMMLQEPGETDVINGAVYDFEVGSEPEPEEDLPMIELPEDAETIFSCDFSRKRFGMVRAEFDNKTWYGDARRSNGYTVCAFFPYAEVFKQRDTVLISIVTLYVILLLVLSLLRRKAEEERLRLVDKQYRIIEAIGSVFATILMVDLRTGEMEGVSVPEYLKPSMPDHAPAEKTMARWNREYVAEPYQAGHDAFMDLSTVEARVQGKSHLEYTYQLKNGAWCQVMMIPKRYGKDGKLEAVLLATRDISAEKRHELELIARLREAADDAKRANIAKTDFLRRMSHDIRTPINGIRGMLQIADHFPDNAEKQAECREKIRQASDFLLDLVNNVLDMNKLESGELTLEEVPFSLQQVSHEVVTILRPQGDEAGVKISTGKLQVTHYQLLGSPLYLRQVLLNLGGNAVKYNRPGGTLQVSCEELGCTDGVATYRFTVADTGLGMSEEFQKHLFEPFSQEHAAGRSSYTGTGLGMPITKELVEKMGGTITFTSKEGVGTTFVVTLPFKVDTADHAAAAPADTADCDLHGTRALLVEDNALNREIAEFLLSNEGVAVTQAVDGAQAVEIFEKSEPGTFDYILMDVMMPVMDGLEATRRIRSMDRPDAGTVPIFAMTANAFSDDVRSSREAGMNEHLAKPLDSALLIDKLRQYRKK